MIRIHLEKVEEWPSWARHIRRFITIGAAVFGRIFAEIYSINLRQAIPLLIKELQSE